MKDKHFFDSNIFLYAFSNKDMEKQIIAKNIILESGTISTQVLNEVSVNMLKKLNLKEKDVTSFVKSAYYRYNILVLSENSFITASKIRDNYNISYFDSIIIGVALNHNCSILYTEDMQHGQLIDDSLKIINPFIKN